MSSLPDTTDVGEQQSKGQPQRKSKDHGARGASEEASHLTHVPFVDLSALHQELRGQFHQALDQILFEDSLVFGAALQRFEERFAESVKAQFCAGTSNGADALELIFRAILHDESDEVIVPANSFFASASAVSLAGGRVVFCDVEANGLMSTRTVAPKISGHTKAILPVHLYGQCVEMEPLMNLAVDRGLFVIEDAAQAHGAFDHNRPAGSLGHAAAFSFYPTKNLGALGDAGAITTNDEPLIAKVKEIRNYGSTTKYIHQSIGRNARMDSLQAAFLSVKLPFLQRAIARRRTLASLYIEKLAEIPVKVIPFRRLEEHAFHLFVVRLPSWVSRSDVQSHLQRHGVQTAIHYPRPIHRQKAYSFQSCTSLPMVEAMADTCLSLPLYETMTSRQLEAVCTALKQYPWGN